MKFSQKNIENWRFWKMTFFWVGHFEFYFFKKKIFFASSLWKLVTNYVLDLMGLNFYNYDSLQPKMRAAIINEHECILENRTVTQEEHRNFKLYPNSKTKITFFAFFRKFFSLNYFITHSCNNLKKGTFRHKCSTNYLSTNNNKNTSKWRLHRDSSKSANNI